MTALVHLLLRTAKELN